MCKKSGLLKKLVPEATDSEGVLERPLICGEFIAGMGKDWCVVTVPSGLVCAGLEFHLEPGAIEPCLIKQS